MNFESLVSSLSAVQNALQATAANAVNISITCRNWLMGYYIVEFEQNGIDRFCDSNSADDIRRIRQYEPRH